MALLDVQGIKKNFGALKALDGAGLAIGENSFHGLIGPNGSGKSTLLKAIAGAHFADAGSVVFDGRDLTRALPYERSRAGMSLKFQITVCCPSCRSTTTCCWRCRRTSRHSAWRARAAAASCMSG